MRGAVGQGRQLINRLRQSAWHARVVDTQLWIFHRIGWPAAASQDPTRTIRIAIDQRSDHVADVFFRAAQPVLERHEIGAHILGCSGDEAQQLRNAPQHLHLRCAAGGSLVLVVATQLLEQRHRARGRLAHVEATQPCELDYFGGRHHADQCIALIASRFKCRHQRQKVIFEKQHRDDHDVTVCDVGQALFKPCRIRTPL